MALEYETLGADDPHHAVVEELIQLLGEATRDFRERWPDKAEGCAILSSAANLFAGIQMGLLFGLGELERDQLPAVRSSAAANFKEGMRAGQEMAAKGRRDLQ